MTTAAIAVAASLGLVVAAGGGAAPASHFFAAPAWSPRGNVIAFVDYNDLYVVRADGTGLRKLTASTSEPSPNYGANFPDWSPRGNEIAFGYGTAGISVIRADGSGLRKIRENGAMPAWSPHGKRIAFIWPDWPASSVWVMRPDGSGRWLVANPPDDQTSLFAPAWSADGQRLAFCVGAAADTGVQTGELAIVSQYRGRLRFFMKRMNPWSVAWSPNGKRLAVSFDPVVNDPNPAAHTRVGLFDLRTRRLRPLHRGSSPTWSPAGRRIAFSYDGDIWVMNANGTGAHRITHSG